MSRKTNPVDAVAVLIAVISGAYLTLAVVIGAVLVLISG